MNVGISRAAGGGSMSSSSSGGGGGGCSKRVREILDEILGKETKKLKTAPKKNMPRNEKDAAGIKKKPASRKPATNKVVKKAVVQKKKPAAKKSGRGRGELFDREGTRTEKTSPRYQVFVMWTMCSWGGFCVEDMCPFLSGAPCMWSPSTPCSTTRPIHTVYVVYDAVEYPVFLL